MNVFLIQTKEKETLHRRTLYGRLFLKSHTVKDFILLLLLHLYLFYLNITQYANNNNNNDFKVRPFTCYIPFNNKFI